MGIMASSEGECLPPRAASEARQSLWIESGALPVKAWNRVPGLQVLDASPEVLGALWCLDTGSAANVESRSMLGGQIGRVEGDGTVSQ